MFNGKSASLPCFICKKIIEIDQDTQPIESTIQSIQPNKRQVFNWCHRTCVPKNDIRIPLCKHWTTRGICIFKETCSFRHPEEERKTKSLQRKGTKDGQRNRVYKEGRAGVMRRWLLRTFGENYLKSGFVLDVAGGKGELSFELYYLNNIQTCIIDPRPVHVDRNHKKLQRGYYHKNIMMNIYNSVPKPINELNEICLNNSIKHLRAYFEINSISSSDISSKASVNLLSNQESFNNGIQLGLKTNWSSVNDEQHEDDNKIDLDIEANIDINVNNNIDNVENNNNNNVENKIDKNVNNCTHCHFDILSLDWAREKIENCSILLGMHSDQATEHILKYAISNNKPCAIVPCCVCRNSALHRQNIRSYDEFISYLMSLHSEIKGVELDFDGKNILLYYLGDVTPLNDPTIAIPMITRGPYINIEEK
jgi:hypothetical protein